MVLSILHLWPRATILQITLIMSDYLLKPTYRYNIIQQISRQASAVKMSALTLAQGSQVLNMSAKKTCAEKLDSVPSRSNCYCYR